MKKEEKKEWIIRYIKRNHLNDILSEKYTEANSENVLKKYSSEIQSICSIISALVIGIMSVILSIQNNRLVGTQNALLKEQFNPIIDVSVSQESDYLDRLEISNMGTVARSYNVNIYSFIDVFCNENGFGRVPIRVYFLDLCKEINMNDDNVATVIIYNNDYPQISILQKQLRNIPKQFTDLAWGFPFRHLIEIISVNSLGDTQTDYFLKVEDNVVRVENELAKQIINERSKKTPVGDGVYEGVESFFMVDDSNAEQIFKYVLQKVRDQNLYCTETKTTDEGVVISEDKVLYGIYEP